MEPGHNRRYQVSGKYKKIDTHAKIIKWVLASFLISLVLSVVILRVCLWWTLYTVYLLACHVRVTVGADELLMSAVWWPWWIREHGSVLSWVRTLRKNKRIKVQNVGQYFRILKSEITLLFCKCSDCMVQHLCLVVQLGLHYVETIPSCIQLFFFFLFCLPTTLT